MNGSPGNPGLFLLPAQFVCRKFILALLFADRKSAEIPLQIPSAPVEISVDSFSLQSGKIL
jgi:hypothetical protein